MPRKMRDPDLTRALAVAADGMFMDERRAVYSAEESAAGAAKPAGAAHERDLIAAAQTGDEAAFRELYKSYHRRIWTLVLYSIGDPLQAQDVFQTVFFKAHRGLHAFRFQSGLFTWIYRIARNECLNHLRRRRTPALPLEAILGSGDEVDARALPPGLDARSERDAVLRQAVMRLPLKLREVVVLKYLEGLSYEEMSRALGCAPGTVASRLNRALTELGARLQPLRRFL
jgi:RNA polymerase sigma-70 factor (ECF subfamily)